MGETHAPSQQTSPLVVHTGPLVPWSAAGAFMAGTLGVATVEYLPWAVMNYTGFVFALILAATGIGTPISATVRTTAATSGSRIAFCGGRGTLPVLKK